MKLHHLRRFDERLAGHLDGLSIAGKHAQSLCAEALESPSADAVFVAAVLAVMSRQREDLDKLLALVEAAPAISKGLTAALGWVEPTSLQGIVASLLGSENPFRQSVGITACALHRVDPGFATGRWTQHSDPVVRARALRAAGELGRVEFVSALPSALHDPDPLCRLWAAWSAVLLGNRQNALEFLGHATLEAGPLQERALQLALQALSIADGQVVLSRYASDPAQQRTVVRGAGFIGDPAHIPWLISLMSDDRLARLAGEVFSFITGTDLAELDLERTPPETVAAGPNDDPDNPHVKVDEDEDLPWPDPVQVQSWWTQNQGRFTTGIRYFAGSPVTREQCLYVLQNGYQRQRSAASLHLCLLSPGTPLFEWRAPASRQQYALGTMKDAG
jgi:uncharacterized protein (TIGR02270 family)